MPNLCSPNRKQKPNVKEVLDVLDSTSAFLISLVLSS